MRPTYFRETHSEVRKLSDFDSFFKLLLSSKRTAVLTGAGISTLSGIPDFRSSNGIYSKKFGSLPVERLLEIDFFMEHPSEFYSWARNGWYSDAVYKPSIVHETVKLMEDKGLLSDGVWTQNIDSLHTYCGSRKVYELHGTLRTSTCTKCGRKYTFEETREALEGEEYPHCSLCGSLVRPDIIFYGENLDSSLIEKAYSTMRSVDLIVVLGSSLVVNPVASLPLQTLYNGGHIVIVNRDRTYIDDKADFVFDDLNEWGEKTLEFLEKC